MTLILMFSTFLFTATFFVALAYFGCERLAAYMKEHPEGKEAVVRHLLIPIFGWEPKPEKPAEPEAKKPEEPTVKDGEYKEVF